MKLKEIRLIGRYAQPNTGRVCNIYKGRKVRGIGPVYFYRFRFQRVFIPESEFHNATDGWKRVE